MAESVERIATFTLDESGDIVNLNLKSGDVSRDYSLSSDEIDMLSEIFFSITVRRMFESAL